MEPARLWQLGDYATVAHRWADAGERLVAQVVRPGDRVLDVACGPGAMAIEAARAGAIVTGLDVTPSLLAAARARAEAAGVAVRWVEADMTAMPEPDGGYDRVLSAFGAIFAPDPHAMAAELVRVCAPGGLVATLGWTPDSPFGRQRAIAVGYLPPGAATGADAEAWGDPDRAREFFSGLPVGVETTVDTIEVRWPTLEAAVEEIMTLVPGWVAARSALEPAGVWPSVEADIAEMFGAAGRTDEAGFVLPVPYLITLARPA
jgi:SAM-dependent methyltransferase